MKLIAIAAALFALAAAPGVASATAYWAFGADGKTLAMTDLRTPRLTSGLAQVYEIVVLRARTTVIKKPTDYEIIEIDFRCDKGKMQQQYMAVYDGGGTLQASTTKPAAWSKTPSDGPMAQMMALGCHATKPTLGFPIGDKRVSEIMAAYRAGRYDHGGK